MSLPDAVAPTKPASPPPPRETRNLVIVYQPAWQAKSDWIEIGEHVRRIDPSIGVYLMSCEHFDERAAARAAELPSLVFSPGPLIKYENQRGRKYHGQSIPKLEQVRRLVDAGVSVPRTSVLQPGVSYDPAKWGEFVVVKPTHYGSSSKGRGFQLIRTERVRYIAPADYPEDHPGRRGPMMIQQFIETGEHVTTSRVLTLFGQPLYMVTFTTRTPRVALTADDAAIEAAPIAHQQFDIDRSWRYDADIIALAKQAHRAMPEIPLKGIDIVRDSRTGRAYVLEVNPNSNSWHFSSPLMADERAAMADENNQARRTQLDAFGTAAHVLAQRTLAEAE